MRRIPYKGSLQVDPKDKGVLNFGGVYLITANNKYFYVGSTNRFFVRFASHMSLIRRLSHDNSAIRNLSRKNANFLFQVVETVENQTKDRIESAEQHYLDMLFKDKLCINISGEAGSGRSNGKSVILNGQEYESIVAAAVSIGVSPSQLSQWLNGFASIPGTYRIRDLRFKDSETKTRSRKKHMKIPVVINGKRYGSIASAAKENGISHSFLCLALLGKKQIPERYGITSLGYAFE